ncbi:hypothetical protein [Nitrospirillum sp. BR 11163]|uniref:hypothetical protein n=1 Tax=Nitrospirillum sp. BR 11163 TaxID=3104323 RepID=UPI002AFE5B94|nr:hypothetical protein [Nitrospirillum sp. BR 11163]MEA1673191.1 hypothetical protein [Nitrospirillum sp. BR 11163]
MFPVVTTLVRSAVALAADGADRAAAAGTCLSALRLLRQLVVQADGEVSAATLIDGSVGACLLQHKLAALKDSGSAPPATPLPAPSLPGTREYALACDLVDNLVMVHQQMPGNQVLVQACAEVLSALVGQMDGLPDSGTLLDLLRDGAADTGDGTGVSIRALPLH